jgi:hypothetical protein
LDVVNGTANSANWIRFAGNVGAVNPQWTGANAVGVLLGWNNNSGTGESDFLWGTSTGTQPDLLFKTWNGTTQSEKMRVTSGGNVGIGTSTPGGALDIVGAGASSSVIVPRDTTANRPGTGVNGMIRYNTTTQRFEAYEAGAWTNMIGGGGGSVSFPLLASPGTTPSSAPSYSFTGNTNSGLFSQSAGTVALVSGGTTALTAVGSNVAIGTTNPNYNFSSTKLDVFSTDSNANKLTVENSLTTSTDRYPGGSYANYMGSTTFGGYPTQQFWNARGSMSSPTDLQSGDALGLIEFHGKGGNPSAYIKAAATQNQTAGSADGGSLSFATTTNSTSTGGVIRMTIDNTGNVGIGTTAPNVKLTINENAAALSTPPAGAEIQIAAADGSTSSMYMDAFATNPELDFRRANTSGASPSAVNNNDSLGRILWKGYGASAWLSNSAAKVEAIAAENWTNATGASALIFATRPTGSVSTPTERMRIDSAGNLGIGTTSPSNRLDARDTQSANAVAYIYNTNTGASAEGLRIQIDATTPASTNLYASFKKSGGTTIGSISGDGAGGIQYNMASDRRLKGGIRDTHYTIDDLMKVRVRDYYYLGHNVDTNGFIAQELYEAYPPAVSKPADESKAIWQVDYGRLTPLIVKGVQDLHGMCMATDEQLQKLQATVETHSGEIENLKREVQSLKDRNDELERKLDKVLKHLNLND